MKTNRYLLPTYYKAIGWFISIPSAVGLLIYYFCKPWDAVPPQIFRELFQEQPWDRILGIFSGNPILASVCMVVLMAGLLFIAFSRYKREDEYITKLRGDSLIWAVVVNSVLMTILSVTVFGGWFLLVSFFNLYTTLVLFVIKFTIALKCLKKESGNEE